MLTDRAMIAGIRLNQVAGQWQAVVPYYLRNERSTRGVALKVELSTEWTADELLEKVGPRLKVEARARLEKELREAQTVIEPVTPSKE